MELPNDTNFYWACIHALKEERFWRKYFIDRAERTIEDKLNLVVQLVGNGILVFNNGEHRQMRRNRVHLQIHCSGVHRQMPHNGFISKCSTVGYTTCSTMGCASKYSTMRFITKYSTMGSNICCSTMGLITDHSSMGIITRCSTIYSSEKCSTWIFPRNRRVSPEFGFTNYASTSKASRPRRRGGLFNIWGTERGLNLNETQESDSTSDN
ncbi:unnamed protein product [Brassica napus]|nr:unnamed protein product [Brassica napus]